ncbi:MAG: hypothetical protein J7L69_06165 [Desulfobulbaceae bacterium]|nr:hypothetical protein [Desulfobulbaceae bacterium]
MGKTKHRRIGSVKSELVKKSREAALAAGQTQHAPPSPTALWKEIDQKLCCNNLEKHT